MNLSILSAMLIIAVSFNQASGAIINNLKSEKEITSVDEVLVNPVDAAVNTPHSEHSDHSEGDDCPWFCDSKRGGMCNCKP